MGQHFCGFCDWPNIRKNKIRELGILIVLLRDCGHHLRNFIHEFSFLEPSVKILSHENFPLYGMLLVWCVYYVRSVVCMCVLSCNVCSATNQ